LILNQVALVLGLRKENPEKLKAAFGRMKTEGLFSVLHQAQSNQSDESVCGYSAAGIIQEVPQDLSGFQKGMRVAIAGAGYANHAETAIVPVNLTIPIPDNVSFQEASTCALGGIAMQGVRRANVSLGDFVVVSGCGAIGLLTIQMLKANGCRVIGLDINSKRLSLAKDLGASYIFNPLHDDTVTKIKHITNGHGADKVILTLATSSAKPLQQAFEMSRRKGTVVLVGVVGMKLERREMYRKEIDFLISTSYGPGRYDDQYEQNGIDYPYGYVRWTEKRNMEAYLQMISDGTIVLDKIINKEFDIDQAPEAYKSLTSEDQPLLVVLSYLSSGSNEPVTVTSPNPKWIAPSDKILRTALVGTGSFVQSMHIPNLQQLNSKYNITSVYDQNGIAARKAKKLLKKPTIVVESNYATILQSDTDLIVIGTRHNSHANLSIEALNAGKAVFVEKPMAITTSDFKKLTKTISQTSAPFMVGYNRRFSPGVKKIKSFTDNRVNPLIVQYTMNAGYVPYDSWVQTDEGGGRIIGEACHIFDLFRSITNSPAVSVSVDGIVPKTSSIRSSDNAVITITYQDGSICSLAMELIADGNQSNQTKGIFLNLSFLQIKSIKEFASLFHWMS